MADSGREELKGSLTIPSETEPRQAAVLLDRERETVSVQFEEQVAGAAEWNGASLRVVDRPKYTEIQFITTDLPKETVELVWKLNASLDNETVAGVVVARPNALRVSGEKGFTLFRSG